MRRTILFVLLGALAGCGDDYDALAKRRIAHAQISRGDIVVAAIDEPGAESYLNGIRLAVEHVNERPGKLLGRTLGLRIIADGLGFDGPQTAILEAARDPRVTAVLGHARSDVAIPASVIYEASQIVFLPPFSAGKGLTRHGFKFVFRQAPSNSLMAEQIASVAQLLGFERIALLYALDNQSRELAFSFEDAALARGMGFSYRRSFSADRSDYRDLITQLVDKRVDMVFVAAGPTESGRMVLQMRHMGVTVPVMGGDALNQEGYKQAVGEAGDNSIAPVAYVARTDTKTNQTFIAEYRQRFRTDPDSAAAQGYDSLRLLATAIEQAKSTMPLALSSTLHYLPYWTGVTGVHVFDERGEVFGKKYFFQVLRDGEWHVLPAVHLPYFLGRFQRTIEAASARADGVPAFGKLFATNLHPDDLRIVQLDFLHEILQFNQLGVIHGAEAGGAEPEYLARIKSLGEKRGFGVHPCGVAFAAADPKRIEGELLNCYGKLTLVIDALNIAELRGVDHATAVRLQQPLEHYRIPVLALHGDTTVDEGMAIRIGRLADKEDIHTDYYTRLFSGILHGKRVYELTERLDNLPVLAVNLKRLNDFGLLSSGRLMGLAPDVYLEWFVSSQP
ncbi:extracellular ligand-binding receptor [Methylocaldum marinum]|uniref:Extracellular ligand-binding receptor n=1 Tax=Methylocaldum marinum TaxID=1432792 RepID=A0A250KQL4_9GAMM|nr:ABC transporter substrate-binding protein [Methylocaldum marinum]BBA33887.1 extracellular ligand-binding receptor [Methylocaldum marinum]